MVAQFYNLFKIICIALIATFIEGCNNDIKKDTKTENANAKPLIPVVVDNADPDCVEFAALWSAGDIAEQLGKDKKWVFLNYTVDLWDTPPADGDGNTVGKLRASSYARIIKKRGKDYMVESPINQAQGWLSKEHVKTISKKNPKTRALCE